MNENRIVLIEGDAGMSLGWQKPFPCDEHNGAHLIRRAVGEIGACHISVTECLGHLYGDYEVLVQNGADGFLPEFMNTQEEVVRYLIERLSIGKRLGE